MSGFRLTRAVLLEIARKYVFGADDVVKWVQYWPKDGGLAAGTDRHTVLLSRSDDFRLAAADWMGAVVVAEHLDVRTDGAPMTTGIAVFSDGRSLSLSDPDGVAFLAGALLSGLDPVAYAEILVAWHPWSGWPASVVTVDPGPALSGTEDGGAMLTFESATVPPDGAPVRHQWQVDVPTSGLASWSRTLRAQTTSR